jgi:cytochrome c oxidase cbb3-type subunit 3
MSYWKQIPLGLLALVLPGMANAQQPGSPLDPAFAPNAALERGREVYWLRACHFCHGIDLTRANGGAADLMHSALVGRDENGNLIGAVVLAGIPQTQTAMPRYPDMDKAEISDLAAYIHYLRQQGRYKELAAMRADPAGDPKAGQVYFNGNGKCANCHSVEDISRVAKSYNSSKLRSALLRPDRDPLSADAKRVAGRKAHWKLVEKYSDDDVRNLIAYIRSAK